MLSLLDAMLPTADAMWRHVSDSSCDVTPCYRQLMRCDAMLATAHVMWRHVTDSSCDVTPCYRQLMRYLIQSTTTAVSAVLSACCHCGPPAPPVGRSSPTRSRSTPTSTARPTDWLSSGTVTAPEPTGRRQWLLVFSKPIHQLSKTGILNELINENDIQYKRRINGQRGSFAWFQTLVKKQRFYLVKILSRQSNKNYFFEETKTSSFMSINI